MAWQLLSEGIAQARREMAVRARRDIEQKEIADAIGVSVTAYSRWERGERIPNEAAVQKLAKFFGVTPAYLRYGVVAELNPTTHHHFTDAERPSIEAQAALDDAALAERRRVAGGRPRRGRAAGE
jgi:transcriptional regulator with XRE-family HTH domain